MHFRFLIEVYDVSNLNLSILKYYYLISLFMFVISCSNEHQSPNNLKLWYLQPALQWTEALPVGNGRLGAMVYGGVAQEHIQFNEETLWTGEPHDYANAGAAEYLDEIRQLLLAGKQREAEELAMAHFMSDPLRQKAYQPFGDIYIDFANHDNYSDYYRELDLREAISRISYKVEDVNFSREVFATNPDQSIVVHLTADQPYALNFQIRMDALHEEKAIYLHDGMMVLDVAVSGGVMKGKAKLSVKTNGKIEESAGIIAVSNADEATIFLSASTNFENYKKVTDQPSEKVDTYLSKIRGEAYNTLKRRHILDYQQLFDRFSIDLGTSSKDTLPTDERLKRFGEAPDPQLVALYMQYGRYLLIASSRQGTHAANLQGIWNQDLKPPWDSKYTVNINTEMNYWPAEVTNLSECHEPLFSLIAECAETGKSTAKAHYNANGWVLHHNTDLWRGTAPINHSNHGIWVSGSGWLSLHLWEHFLFTRDHEFLEERAYPIMKEAAVFYKDFLVEDQATGWLISTPSNSPETGGLVAGPTMDHQIIRSLFEACVEAGEILGIDQSFTSELRTMVPKIAPNQIGQYGQLQEWLKDIDDPANKHRHVSHLWGMHPGKDINWEESPELMAAARQSLLMRGDDGTGWSLAWKINFWARFLDGNHAYDLIKMLFRFVESGATNYQRGGSYLNLFDAHPPFQIDGNFGAAAGIVELLIQSHLSYIDILPALPDAFPTGNISGVCARGAFELDFAWENKALTSLSIKSKAGEKCKLRYMDKTIEFETVAGEVYLLDGDLKRLN